MPWERIRELARRSCDMCLFVQLQRHFYIKCLDVWDTSYWQCLWLCLLARIPTQRFSSYSHANMSQRLPNLWNTGIEHYIAKCMSCPHNVPKEQKTICWYVENIEAHSGNFASSYVRFFGFVSSFFWAFVYLFVCSFVRSFVCYSIRLLQFRVLICYSLEYWFVTV